MPQYPQLKDNDVIGESAPPAGVTYKPVTGKNYNAALTQLTGDIGARPDLKDWGPEATRRLYNEAKDQVNASFDAAMKARDLKRLGRNGPELDAELAKITNSYMKLIITDGSVTAANSAEIESQLKEKKQALLDNTLRSVNAELAAVKAPPILSAQANSAFNGIPLNAAGFIIEKSNNLNFKYVDVRPSDATKAAQDLAAGRRDDVANTIKDWGDKSLQAALVEFRDHVWPDEMKKANQALAALGTPQFAEKLDAVQSPELKALLQKESQDFSNHKRLPEIKEDFDFKTSALYGQAVQVINQRGDAVRTQENEFSKDQPSKAPPGAGSPQRAVPQAPPPSALNVDIEQAALKFAREKTASWPNLSGWNGQQLDALRNITVSQIREDAQSAIRVAGLLLAGAAPEKINDIQNSNLRAIVDRDVKKGGDTEDIMKDIKRDVETEQNSRFHFVNQKIDSSYPMPGSAPVPQKPAVGDRPQA